MVTREDVARQAGVSAGTVSNILNGKTTVSPELAEKVKKTIADLGYIPNHHAKSLASKKSKHIGIALYEYENSYHWEIIRGIEEYAAQKGYLVSEFILDNDSEYKLEAICERRLNTLVNFMTNDYPRNFIDILKSQGVNLINFDPSMGPVFKFDYSDAMEEIFAKLVKDGHRNIAYVFSGDELRFDSDTRGHSFKRLVEKYGLNKDSCPVYCNNAPQGLSYEIGYKGCRCLFEKHRDITAVFGTNDLVAIGIMRALKEMKYSVPDDVSVIGCDDTAISRHFIPSITSIGFDKRMHGRQIAEIIIDKINMNKPHENIHELKPQAIFRESTDKKKEQQYENR